MNAEFTLQGLIPYSLKQVIYFAVFRLTQGANELWVVYLPVITEADPVYYSADKMV